MILSLFKFLIYMLVKLLKTKQGKLATIFVVARLVTGVVLSMSITIPTLSGVIIMAIDAYILSWILVAVDNALPDLKLIP